MGLAACSRLGPYEIVELLGSGGMGEVWKARDVRLGRVVAIKRLKLPHSSRFLDEARLVASLNHPNVCVLHDIGPDYLVMEYIEGETVAAKTKRGPLPLTEVRRIAGQVANALAAAHRTNIVHLDLKPANIMETPDGLIKVLDFGLAKIVRRTAPAMPTDSTVTATLAPARDISGTPGYMSPEQAEGKRVDARSDVFSFGAVLYEMLTGRRAFEGESAIAAMAAVMRDDPPPAALPPGWRHLVFRCLRKNRDDRFRDMAEVVAALDAVESELEENSIAVLPFANLSHDLEQEYFSDGLTEEVINALAQVAALKVIARTSVFAFKGRNEDVRTIAQALDVSHILEGSVRKSGNRLRVTAQLVVARDGTHLWSERYDREIHDVFSVQDDISEAIVRALCMKLVPTPANPERRVEAPAFDAMLRGRHLLWKQTPDAVARAEQYFHEAAQLDPAYADPHSALGLHYALMATQGMRRAREAMPLARAEAERVLTIDNGDCRGHGLFGIISAYDYDWGSAEASFRKALLRQPPPELHMWYEACFCLPQGLFREGAAHARIASASDPLNPMWRSLAAEALSFGGMYDEAANELRRALEADENHWHVHLVFAHMYAVQGKVEDALASAARAYHLAPWESRVAGTYAGLLARTGRADESNCIADKLANSNRMGMVLFGTLMNKPERAAEWYEKAIDNREPLAVIYARSPVFASLHRSAFWPRLASAMKLRP